VSGYCYFEHGVNLPARCAMVRELEAKGRFMEPFYCEKEKEIITAMRAGTLDAELGTHASKCPVCSETVAVSEFLQAGGTAEPVLPDSDFIWWKGQFAAKQMALERATRSIVLVRKIAYLSVSATVLWFVFAPGHLQPMMGALSKLEIGSTGYLRGSALLSAAGALIFMILGSLYMARLEE
jgi:hypothetical protein